LIVNFDGGSLHVIHIVGYNASETSCFISISDLWIIPPTNLSQAIDWTH
jgi:hypothetical protein